MREFACVGIADSLSCFCVPVELSGGGFAGKKAKKNFKRASWFSEPAGKGGFSGSGRKIITAVSVSSDLC
jgi:hypothetical protein